MYYQSNKYYEEVLPGYCGS